MTRVRTFVLTVIAALVVSLLPQAAHAAARTHITVRVDAGVGSGERLLSPEGEVRITFWRLDDAGEYYSELPDGAWTELGGGVWSSPELEGGEYAVRFIASDESIGMQYWDRSRYWATSTDITITAGQTVDLGTVRLEPWALDVERVAGANRYDTAVGVSQLASQFGFGPSAVFLANGLDYPDALAAGPVAISSGATLLLTSPTSLPAQTERELARLDPDLVVIVGGRGAVGDGVEGAVRRALPSATVGRIEGRNRYATAEALVRAAFADTGAPVAFVATGRNYPDALAAGAAAGYRGAPVILLDGASGSLGESTRALLRDLGVGEVVIAGGAGAVTVGIERDLQMLLGSGNVVRHAGGSRYETAALVNVATFPPQDFAFIASGANFPDALAAVPLAGMLGVPVHLTPPSCLAPVAVDALAAQRPNGLFLLGGPGAVGAAVEDLRVCG